MRILRGPPVPFELDASERLNGRDRPPLHHAAPTHKEDEMTTTRELHGSINALGGQTADLRARIAPLEAEATRAVAAEADRVKAAQGRHGTPEHAALVAKHAAALDAELAANPGDVLAATKKVNKDPEFAPLFGALTSQEPTP